MQLTCCNKPDLAGAELSCLALEHSPAAFPEPEHPRVLPPWEQLRLPCQSPHRLQLSSNRHPPGLQIFTILGSVFFFFFLAMLPFIIHPCEQKAVFRDGAVAVRRCWGG